MLHSIYEKIISWFIRLVWQTKISSKVDIREYHWYFQLFYYFLENSDLFQIKNPGHFFCKEVDSELSSIEHQHFQQLHDEINETFNKEQMVQVPYIPVTVSLYNTSPLYTVCPQVFHLGVHVPFYLHFWGVHPNFWGCYVPSNSSFGGTKKMNCIFSTQGRAPCCFL